MVRANMPHIEGVVELANLSLKDPIPHKRRYQRHPFGYHAVHLNFGGSVRARIALNAVYKRDFSDCEEQFQRSPISFGARFMVYGPF